jgi:hypothetical protein
VATLDITTFGAVGNGTTDCRAAINNCFASAAAGGHDVFIPNGTFKHNGTLTFNGSGRIFGNGDTSILKAGTSGQEALFLTANGVRIENLMLIGFGSPRMSADETQKLVLQTVDNFVITGVHIKDTTTGGMKMNGCSNGHIHHNTVENTHADSIHMTISGSLASHDIVVEDNTVRFSGDDGVAVVTYGGPSHVKCSNITIRNNDIRFNTNGRGIGILGGQNILIYDNVVHGGTSDKAGIYIAAEGNIYDTSGVDTVCAALNELTDCGSSGSTGHGSFVVYNSQPGARVDNVRIASNTIINSRKFGIAVIGGHPGTLNYYNNTHTGSAFALFASINSSIVASTTPVASCPPPAEPIMSTYYVRNGGNDNANGLSEANAWATIQKVNGIAFVSGDTVRFQRGSSWNVKLVPRSGVQYADYGTGARPLIQNVTSHGIELNAKTSVTVRNMDIRNCSGSGIRPFGGSHSLLVEGCNLQNNGTAGTSFNDHNIIGNDSDNIVIRNCTLSDSIENMYFGNCDNLLCENVTAHSPNSSIGDNIQVSFSSNPTIRGCNFSNVPGGKGQIALTGGSGGLVENTIFTGPGLFAVGIGQTGTITVRNCQSTGCQLGINWGYDWSSTIGIVIVQGCDFINASAGIYDWTQFGGFSRTYRADNIYFNNCTRCVEFSGANNIHGWLRNSFQQNSGTQAPNDGSGGTFEYNVPVTGTRTPTVPQTYFVKNGGNDSNTGLSDALAWATVSKVNSISMGVGSVVQFARGSTFNGVRLNAKEGVTYRDYGSGNKPIFTAAADYGVQVAVDDVILQNLRFLNCLYSAVLIPAGTNSNVEFDECEFEACGGTSAAFQNNNVTLMGGSDIRFDTCIFDSPVFAGNLFAQNVTDLEVLNCTMSDPQTGLTPFPGKNIFLLACTNPSIRLSDFSGDNTNGHILINNGIGGLIQQNNLLNGVYGISLGQSGLTIDANVIDGTGSAANSTGIKASSDINADVTNVSIVNNDIKNWSYGFFCDLDAGLETRARQFFFDNDYFLNCPTTYLHIRDCVLSGYFQNCFVENCGAAQVTNPGSFAFTLPTNGPRGGDPDPGDPNPTLAETQASANDLDIRIVELENARAQLDAAISAATGASDRWRIAILAIKADRDVIKNYLF